MGETSSLLSTAQFGRLALDSAFEIDDFLRGDGNRLTRSKHLLERLLEGIDLEEDGIGLSHLSFYEIAFGTQKKSVPSRVDSMAEQYREILSGYLSAERDSDRVELAKLKSFCIAIHRRTVQNRLGSAAYLEFPQLRSANA